GVSTSSRSMSCCTRFCTVRMPSPIRRAIVLSVIPAASRASSLLSLKLVDPLECGLGTDHDLDQVQRVAGAAQPEAFGELVGRGPGALDLFLGAADALLLGGDEGGQADARFDGAVPVRRARQPGDQSGGLQAGQD